MDTGSLARLEQLLQPTFAARHVQAALKHHQEMNVAFQQGDWEKTIGKSGKFVEAALKALSIHIGRAVPSSRQFKAASVIRDLEQSASGSFDDTIRLTIPRGCRFTYDIASNRGARHDPDEVDSNQMDARAVVAVSAWILAEMLRYAQKGTLAPDAVRELVDALTERQYPLIEDVEGRVYFHITGLSARDVAVLSLWHKYPERLPKDALVIAVMRHGFNKSNAKMAVSRIGRLVDRSDQGLRLLQPGIHEAEKLIDSARNKRVA